MRVLRRPLLSLCLATLAGAMLLPCLYALLEGDWASLRIFAQCLVFTGFAAAVMMVVSPQHKGFATARSELIEMLLCWFLVPVFAAAPLWLRTPFIGHYGAWFEMVCAFTTTGGTVYEEPAKIPQVLHLWRGLVAWLGGLFTLTAAFAILAPRNLGGFEVSAPGASETSAPILFAEGSLKSREVRLAQALRGVLPIYAGMTLLLGFFLAAFGQETLPAAVHAMGLVSTSGVTPHGLGLAETPNIGVEAVAALFMVAAATRLVYSDNRRIGALRRWVHDPELRLMLFLVTAATLAIFARHWLGALTVAEGDTASSAGTALWGAIFTTLSFLTTTGFESASWHSAQDWSGLDNPGLILLGLCSIGGGAATTAGGIKLLRAHILLRQSARELERIGQPNSATGGGAHLRGILREGAFLAWAFIMLYSAVVFLAMIALTMTGLAFQNSLAAALSAISNTGPAFSLVTPVGVDFAHLSESQRTILAITMVIGRIEVLAAISFFNPDSWSPLRFSVKSAGNAVHKKPDSKW